MAMKGSANSSANPSMSSTLAPLWIHFVNRSPMMETTTSPPSSAPLTAAM